MDTPVPSAPLGPVSIQERGLANGGAGVFATLVGLAVTVGGAAVTGSPEVGAGLAVIPLGGLVLTLRGLLGTVAPLGLTIDSAGLLVVRRGAREQFRVQLSSIGVDNWQFSLYGDDDTMGRIATIGVGNGLRFFANATPSSPSVNLDALDRTSALSAMMRHTQMVPQWLVHEAGPAHRSCLVFRAPVRMLWTSSGFRLPEPGVAWDLEAVAEAMGVRITLGPRTNLVVRRGEQLEASAGASLLVEPGGILALVGEDGFVTAFHVFAVFQPPPGA